MDDFRQLEPEATSEAVRHNLETSYDQSPTADGTEQTTEEVTMEAAPSISLSDLSDEQLRGTFFTHAHNFGVSGGTFQSIKNMHIHHASPAEPPPFPTIPMGYLNLLHELLLNADTGVVDRHQSPVRRAHSARIHGSESTMTVAIYEGDKAEENWREAVSRHSNLRHPNIIQLFGTARAPRLHAAIFHDELIPAQQMAEKYDTAPICAVYFRHFLGTRSLTARKYVQSVSGDYPYSGECTLWIRPSTGGLCLDLTPDEFDFDSNYESVFHKSRHAATGDHLLEPHQHSDILADISVRHYHEACYWYLSKHLKLSISAHISLKLGTVYRNLGANCDSPVEVAFLSEVDCTDLGWQNPNGIKPGQIMEDGWVCIPSGEVDHEYSGSISNWLDVEGWLSQANHIFKCLDITSNYEDYVVLEDVWYQLTFPGPTDGLPPGYIFLCPRGDLHSDDPPSFRHPDCPAYWSLDPTGVKRLSAEAAESLGFPSFEFEMLVFGKSWGTNVYDGLRQFHEAKGFDPCSQDIARHLGCPLFQLSDRIDAVSAYLEEVNSEADYDESIHSEISVQDIPPTEIIQSQTQQFVEFPTHLDVDLPADRSFGTSSDYLWPEAAFDLVSIPSSSSTFSFPPPHPPRPAYLPYHSETIQNASAGCSHPFNTPPPPPGQLDAFVPLNTPTRARTADQPEAERESSARPNKKMRLDFIMGGGGF